MGKKREEPVIVADGKGGHDPLTMLRARYWLTAKAHRALGHPVPVNVADDEVITLQVAS